MSNDTNEMPNPNPMPDIEEAFRARANQISDSWQANKLSFQDALKQLESLRQEAITTGNRINEGGIYNTLGIIYGYRSNYDESINQFTKARDIYEKEGVKRRVATCDLNLGETYRLRSNYTKARQYFHSAYEAAKSIGIPDLQCVALTNEAQMWFSLKSYDKAKKSLEEALHIATHLWQTSNERDETRRLDNLCEVHYAFVYVYLQENNNEKAWEDALAALEIAKKIERSVRFGYANRALGDVVTALGNAPEGYSNDPDEYYQAALEAFRQVKAEADVGKTLFAQGQSYAKRGKSRSAGQKLQQAMVIFTKLGMTEDAAKAAEAQMSLF